MSKKRVQPVAFSLVGILLFNQVVFALPEKTFGAPTLAAVRISDFSVQAFALRSTWAYRFGKYIQGWRIASRYWNSSLRGQKDTQRNSSSNEQRRFQTIRDLQRWAEGGIEPDADIITLPFLWLPERRETKGQFVEKLRGEFPELASSLYSKTSFSMDFPVVVTRREVNGKPTYLVLISEVKQALAGSKDELVRVYHVVSGDAGESILEYGKYQLAGRTTFLASVESAWARVSGMPGKGNIILVFDLPASAMTPRTNEATGRVTLATGLAPDQMGKHLPKALRAHLEQSKSIQRPDEDFVAGPEILLQGDDAGFLTFVPASNLDVEATLALNKRLRARGDLEEETLKRLEGAIHKRFWLRFRLAISKFLRDRDVRYVELKETPKPPEEPYYSSAGTFESISLDRGQIGKVRGFSLPIPENRKRGIVPPDLSENHLIVLTPEQEQAKKASDSIALSFEDYWNLTERAKQALRDEFLEVFKPRSSAVNRLFKDPPHIYPLTQDEKLANLLNAATKLASSYPTERIFALGRTPLWFIETARLLENNSSRYEYVAFSGRWYERGPGNRLRPGPTAPNKAQIAAYRTYLASIGCDPLTIVTKANQEGQKTVLVEYTQYAESLTSFLSVLDSWAAELGVAHQLKTAMVIHILQDPVLQKIHYVRGFQIQRQEVDHGLIWELANSDDFDDSMGIHYPYLRWQELVPGRLGSAISRNAALVRFRIIDYLAHQGLLPTIEAPPPSTPKIHEHNIGPKREPGRDNIAQMSGNPDSGKTGHPTNRSSRQSAEYLLNAVESAVMGLVPPSNHRLESTSA